MVVRPLLQRIEAAVLEARPFCSLSAPDEPLSSLIDPSNAVSPDLAIPLKAQRDHEGPCNRVEGFVIEAELSRASHIPHSTFHNTTHPSTLSLFLKLEEEKILSLVQSSLKIWLHHLLSLQATQTQHLQLQLQNYPLKTAAASSITNHG